MRTDGAHLLRLAGMAVDKIFHTLQRKAASDPKWTAFALSQYERLNERYASDVTDDE